MNPGRGDNDVRMVVRDRDRLRALIAIAGLSKRQVAVAAGWRSHSYLQRLLRGDVSTLRPDPAVRIEHLLGVQPGDLFAPRPTRNVGRADHTAERVA